MSIKNNIIFLIVFGMLSIAGSVFAANQAQYNAMPPFLGTEVPPNVMFMLDNSGSMKQILSSGGFDSSKTYYGMFEGDKNYKYDNTIEVDLNGYNGSTDSPYDIDADGDNDTDSNDVDAPNGAFVEDDTCTPGFGVNCWNGSFLNWMMVARIDAARKVMVGGKVEHRNGYDYVTGDGGDLEWKIVANNERSDKTFTRSYSNSQDYTPYPDNTSFKVYSPAEDGTVKTTYDPYRKFKINSDYPIIDKDGNTIGEYGTITDLNQDSNEDNWKTVSLANDYTDPVVVALPLSYNDSDPGVVRIRNVDAADDDFQIRIEEWEYINGNHSTESISYLVIEKGYHELTGGQIIAAVTTDIDTDYTNFNISAAGYSSAPVVFSSVITNNDANTVTIRQNNITKDNISIKLQEEEALGTHANETVSIIALETGNYTAGLNTVFQVGIKEDVTNDDAGSEWHTINFTKTGAYDDPAFLAAMQTEDGSNTAALRYKNLDYDNVEVYIEEEKSVDNELYHVEEDVGYVVISSPGYNLVLVVEEEPTGLLHNFEDDVRLGISFYNYKKDGDIYNGEKYHGGTMKLEIPDNPFVKDSDDTGFRSVETPVAAEMDKIVDAIEHYPLVWGTTPLAENYYEVIRYFQQETPFYPKVNDSTFDTYEYYEVNNDWDPYYFADYSGTLECVQSYVLVFTDGAPYRDEYVPCYDSSTDSFASTVTNDDDCLRIDSDTASGDGASTSNSATTYRDILDDLAYWAYKDVDDSDGSDRDLRDDIDGDQNLITYTVGFGADTVKQILEDTADNAGGIAYAAEDGSQLKDQLTAAFTDIISRSSGTAASVISNTRSGEGYITQSVFFPSLEDDDNKITWAGQMHTLLVDAYGNMREDTNGNDTLDRGGVYSDPDDGDYFIVFNDDGTADRYIDGDGNQRLQLGDDCIKDAENDCYDSLVNTVDLDDLKYLWNSSDWLNEISDADVEDQRIYTTTEDKRYIFTWVDGDSDGVVEYDADEVMDFICSSTPSETDLTDKTKIYPYLHLYPSFADRPAEISALATADLKEFLKKQTRRQINYIRGSDCADSVDSTDDNIDCNTEPLIISSVEIDGSEMRSRQYDYDGDSVIETWRLGDIVYSTPTLVSRPAESFHLLYRDASYASFAAKYHNRRQVVYAGGNDGMVHAFNAGFFDDSDNSFDTSWDSDSSGFIETDEPKEYELGAELWAYVPFNLLPHLYWLTETSYDETGHVYYVDQKPRVFDAKIFPEETICDSDIYDSGCIHPEGWGTVMVVGMNLGGGSIIADIDKTDGVAPEADDPIMKSAFMIFDITNPEQAPTLMAEIVLPDMGFATNYPTVIAMKDAADHNGTYDTYTNGENKWYLAIGSGPADSNGDPGTVDTSDGSYNNEILEDVKSLQDGKFFLLDLYQLGTYKELYTLNSDGVSTAGLNAYATFDDDPKSFIGPPITVDYDLDFNADALYFGTISGYPYDSSDTDSGWAGKLRRIEIKDQSNPGFWESDSVLINVEQPISAAPSVGVDASGRNWVFFGTGRYFTPNDKIDETQQSYYGIKEPITDGEKNWSGLSIANLTDVSNFHVIYSENTVYDGTEYLEWGTYLTKQNEDATKEGWFLDFPDTGERNLGQASLLGGLLSFTTFVPESDICSTKGDSYFWALYYESGTAHYSGILGTTTETINSESKTTAKRRTSLGSGLATSPSVHVGSQTGSTVFVQSSTGRIQSIEQENPLDTKSGTQS